jgi:uncharacterized C2H2 Zn-finger protein
MRTHRWAVSVGSDAIERILRPYALCQVCSVCICRVGQLSGVSCGGVRWDLSVFDREGRELLSVQQRCNALPQPQQSNRAHVTKARYFRTARGVYWRYIGSYAVVHSSLARSHLYSHLRVENPMLEGGEALSIFAREAGVRRAACGTTQAPYAFTHHRLARGHIPCGAKNWVGDLE